MRLTSLNGAGGLGKVDPSPSRDGRGIEVEAKRPQGGTRMDALRSDRGIATAPPREQKCSCDGGGWIVTLDRDRYKAPATSGMVRFARCICLDYAPAPTGRAGPVPSRGASL
jgi:hypothetical protein